MRLLYTKKQSPRRDDCIDNDFLQSCTIEKIRPTLFRPLRRGEKATLSTKLSRVYFWLISQGKACVYYLLDGNRTVHTALVVPKCAKFPFLGKNEYEIGPCVTSPDYRRKGSYAYVLEHITTSLEYEGSRFYMIVTDTNIPSVKGIEKAGFEACGTVKKSRFLKIYSRMEPDT